MATTNLSLELQNQGDANWHTDNNNNFQVIDNFLSLKRVRVYRTTEQSIPNNAQTAIQFNNEAYDTDNMHSNSVNNTRITAITAGFYIVYGAVGWWGTVATGRRRAYIKLNNTSWEVVSEFAAEAEAGEYPMHSLNLQLYLNANDYLEMYVFQTSGDVLNLEAAYPRPSFGMVRVGF